MISHCSRPHCERRLAFDAGSGGCGVQAFACCLCADASGRLDDRHFNRRFRQFDVASFSNSTHVDLGVRVCIEPDVQLLSQRCLSPPPISLRSAHAALLAMRFDRVHGLCRPGLDSGPRADDWPGHWALCGLVCQHPAGGVRRGHHLVGRTAMGDARLFGDSFGAHRCRRLVGRRQRHGIGRDGVGDWRGGHGNGRARLQPRNARIG